MTTIIMLLFPCFSFATPELPPTPFPVFLREGFSTVLEFEEAPIRVVLGDSQSFQVEKLDQSIVVKTLATNTASNMFVYFKTKPPRLFVLTASDEVEPTYYRKFATIVSPRPKPTSVNVVKRTLQAALLRSAAFDNKKDYLTIEVDITAGSNARLIPDWSKARLLYQKQSIEPKRLWSERKEIQKDSKVKARFIFYRPNIPKQLTNSTLVIPLKGESKPLNVLLARRSK